MDMSDKMAVNPNDQVEDLHGQLFDMPSFLAEQSTLVHASAVVVGRHGLLLRGPTGSGKSVLQRYLRRRAKQKGLFAALVSDDYVRLARTEADSFMAFAPIATRNCQEVFGLGIVNASDQDQALSALDKATIHMLVDLIPENEVRRTPARDQQTISCLGGEIPHLCVPKGSSLVAADMVFSALSTL